jgi:2-(1,2-epoxy-1,2-dihydrophenyl)acetyl-CoA isomerase
MVTSQQQVRSRGPAIDVRVENDIAIVAFDQPKRRNALTLDMWREIPRICSRLEGDANVRCIVLTGAGGAFCSGGDVKGMAAGTGGNRGIGLSLDERIHRQRLSQRETAGRIFRMPKPVIASLPGAAAGAGLSLALACDLRIAAESAVITTAFAKVGFSGDYGGTYFLTQLVGSAKARELYYLSDRVDAKEAERLGLVNKVVPDAALAAETRALADRLASGATVAFRYMKENLHRALEGASLEECLDLEATHHVHTGLTEDHREAAKAFVEKRTPTFKGR